MERHEVLEMMSALKLSGLRSAFDEVLANGLKRRHAVHDIIGELLTAQVAEKRARSMKYRLTMAKEPAEFDFSAGPVNEPLVREHATGAFLESKRNVVLVGGTGTGKGHLAVALTRASGTRARCYDVVERVNHLEAEARGGRQGRTAELLCRRDLVVLDELG